MAARHAPQVQQPQAARASRRRAKRPRLAATRINVANGVTRQFAVVAARHHASVTVMVAHVARHDRMLPTVQCQLSAGRINILGSIIYIFGLGRIVAVSESCGWREAVRPVVHDLIFRYRCDEKTSTLQTAVMVWHGTFVQGAGKHAGMFLMSTNGWFKQLRPSPTDSWRDEDGAIYIAEISAHGIHGSQPPIASHLLTARCTCLAAGNRRSVLLGKAERTIMMETRPCQRQPQDGRIQRRFSCSRDHLPPSCRGAVPGSRRPRSGGSSLRCG